MFFKLQIMCTCHCEYSMRENINTEKIVCPNCGLEHPHSAKLISMLKTAAEMPGGVSFAEEVCTRVIEDPERENGSQ